MFGELLTPEQLKHRAKLEAETRRLIDADTQEVVIKFMLQEKHKVYSRSVYDLEPENAKYARKRNRRPWAQSDGKRLLVMATIRDETKSPPSWWKLKRELITVARWVDDRFVVLPSNSQIPSGCINDGATAAKTIWWAVSYAAAALKSQGILTIEVDGIGQLQLEEAKFIASLKGY